MKQLLVVLMITIAMPSFVLAQAPAKGSGVKDEVMFRKLEREMFKATEGTPDLAAVERIWADDFYSINADGSAVDKRRMLEFMRSGRVLADKITSEDFRLRRYGDTAVINGRSAYFMKGQKLAEVLHTQIWARRAGRWRLVGWHGTMTGVNRPQQ